MAEKEDNKLFAGWRNQDWLWLVGILIIIIIMLIAGYKIDELELNFSIISSAVSIALALVAIFIALKQDSDNQRVNYKVDGRLEQITNKLENVDGKVDNVVTTILTNVAEKTADTISDDLIEKKEQYSKEEVEELLNGYNKQIKDTLFKVVNQNKSNDNDSRKIMLYLSDYKNMQDVLLKKYSIGQTVFRNDIIQIMRDLEMRSIPRRLVNRLVETGFLEPNSVDDEFTSYILKGPKQH